MPFIIREKSTGIAVRMRSGKSVWAQAGHAKAAFKTSGPGHTLSQKYGLKWRAGFDSQDFFELVEVNVEVKEKSVRFRFMVDDSGHNYLVPADLQAKFYEELEKDFDINEFDDLFGQYRADSISSYTFENPKED